MDEAARVTDPAESVSSGVAATEMESKPPRERKQRLIEGWCVYSSACPRRATGWPDPIHHLCDRHRVQVQKRQAKAKRIQRQALSEAGKCVRCRKPSTTYRCPACRILDRTTLPMRRVSEGVAARAARIASRTMTHADGRTRYHGQSRRGQQTHAQLDEQDIGFARRDIELGEAGLQQYAHAMELSKVKDPEAMPRIQRDDLRSAALHEIERAVGHLRDVMERHGHVMQDRGGDDDDEVEE